VNIPTAPHDPLQDSRRVCETEPRAPVIGSVRPVPDPRLAPGVPLRPSAIELDGCRLGRFFMAAASVIGLAHALDGRPSQDAYTAAVAPSGELYLAVADGLGSKPASHLGARLLCDAVIELALDRKPRTRSELRDLIHAAGTRMGDIAARAYSLTPDAIACVGVVVAIAEERVTIARVGDSTAFVLDSGHFDELFSEDCGFVNVVDQSMPTDDEDAIETSSRPLGGDALILVSDGLATDLRTSPAVRRWLGECWASPIGPFAMGEALRYRRQGSHDDRTAIALWDGGERPRTAEHEPI
jgi:serine/threonine protein phosphatase PrpC